MRSLIAKTWSIAVLGMLIGGFVARTVPAQHTAHDHQAASSQKPGDRDQAHHDTRGHDPNHARMVSDNDLTVTRVFRSPENFIGTLATDGDGGRFWLLSHGPPANMKGPSTLYEVDPTTGKLLAQARMPFHGEVSAPVYLDGFLYVGVPTESKLYKVRVNDKASLGTIVQSTPLPTLNDLDINLDEPFRFPFINFPSLAVTPDKNILLNAEDIGWLITIDKETGKILNKVPSMKGLSAAIAVPGPNQQTILLANTDPEAAMLKRDMRVFMFRAKHGFTPPYAIRTETPCRQQGARDITWVLLDPQSGEVLASALDRCSRASAGSVALMKWEKKAGTRYGKYTFLTTGEEGVLTIDWLPK